VFLSWWYLLDDTAWGTWGKNSYRYLRFFDLNLIFIYDTETVPNTTTILVIYQNAESLCFLGEFEHGLLFFHSVFEFRKNNCYADFSKKLSKTIKLETRLVVRKRKWIQNQKALSIIARSLDGKRIKSKKIMYFRFYKIFIYWVNSSQYYCSNISWHKLKFIIFIVQSVLY